MRCPHGHGYVVSRFGIDVLRFDVSGRREAGSVPGDEEFFVGAFHVSGVGRSVRQSRGGCLVVGE